MSSSTDRGPTQRQFPEGILGRKLGMTQVFGPNGDSIPVTVIEAGPCVVLDVKQQDKHGYAAVQFGFSPKKPQRCTKAELGHFKNAGKGSFYEVREVRCDVEALGWQTGQEVTVGDVFGSGELVDVVGFSKGRGMTGVVKRFGVRGQPATRGTHENRRHIGAIGCRKFPGRVIKNMKMPGRVGNERVTVQNLRVVDVRPEDNLILVKGGIPGAKGGLVVVQKAVKSYQGVQAKPESEDGEQEAA